MCVCVCRGNEINKGIFFTYLRILHCFELFIDKIVLNTKKYLFWGYSQWREIKENALGINGNLWLIFYEKCKLSVIKRKIYVMYVGACVSNKCLMNMGF